MTRGAEFANLGLRIRVERATPVSTIKETSAAAGRQLLALLPLSKAEEKLRDACRTGVIASFEKERPKAPNDANRIRASVLRVFCLGLDPEAPVHEQGVQIVGAWIDGNLDLGRCTLRHPVAICDSVILGDITLLEASTKTINFGGTRCQSINANGIVCSGSLFLRFGFVAEREVLMLKASINGDLDCSGSTFEATTDQALACDGSEIKGGVFLRDGFIAKGTVRFIGATIKGSLDCNGASFDAPKGHALICDGADIRGCIYLSNGTASQTPRQFTSNNSIRIIGAKIGDSIDCTDGIFFANYGASLTLDRSNVGGSIILEGIISKKGEIEMAQTRIQGNIIFYGAQLKAECENALVCDDSDIKGGVYFSKAIKSINDKNFLATGTIRLPGARIGGDLVCCNANFAGEKNSILLQNATISGIIWLNSNIVATGKIDLSSASLSDFVDDEIYWPKLKLILDGLTYRRFVGDAPTNAVARIRWLDRQPPRHLGDDFRPQPWEQCAKVLAEMGHEQEANLIRIEKRRRMRWLPWKRAASDLGQVATLPGIVFDWLLDKTIGYGWAAKRPLYWLLVLWIAAGTFYWAIAPHGVMTPTDPKVFLASSIPPECRVDWIGFSGPRPPLADDAARRETEATKRDLPATAPWSDICPRAMPSEYSTFSPFAYALDVLLPIVDLRQERDWAPRVADQTGKALLPNMEDDPSGWGYGARFVEWALILSGWALSALLLGAVTGVIRRD